MERELFVRQLAEALPERFSGVDLVDEYYYGEEPGDPEMWGTTVILSDAVGFLGGTALTVDYDQRRSTLRPGGEALLRRFFDFIEGTLATAGEADTGWMAVELFEGVPWTEDVYDLVGARARRLHVGRKESLRMFNLYAGSWDR